VGRGNEVIARPLYFGNLAGMAVYTEVSDDELRSFIATYDVGQVHSCKGIAEGVENSNFLIVTDHGPYILTLYEKRVREADLPYFIGLMEHLAGKGIACPLPVRARDGQALRRLADRPAAMVTFLNGMWPRRVSTDHCEALGAAMAALHAAGADFAMSRPNDLSCAGWRPLFEKIDRTAADTLRPGLAQEIETELAYLEAAWPTNLPYGTIHADAFPDNVFFEDGKLTGFIDFYFACSDWLAYDLAVCLNAWCFEPDGAFVPVRGRALLAAYASVRPFEEAEIAALPTLARGAALRFLLTRLYDWLNHPEGALVRKKDPLEYRRKLAFHRRVQGVADYGYDRARS
jgi:homoserine kinase type II